MTIKTSTTALVLGAIGLTLAACGHNSSSPSTTATAGKSATTSSVTFASARGGSLVLSQGWATSVAGAMPGMAASAMPSMVAGKESAIYATFTETGSSPDALVSVTTPAAKHATLHATRTSANGTSGTMIAIKSVPIPANGSATLAPGGYHIMVTGLLGDFSAGATITVTWHFRSGTVLTTRVPVINPADRPGNS